MVAITYPNGTGGFQTLASDVPHTTADLGSIELGLGYPWSETGAAGAVFHITLVTTGTTTGATTIAFQATVNGTDWFDLDEYKVTQAAVATFGPIRVAVFPNVKGTKAIRVRQTYGSAGNGTTTVKARLLGSYKAVTTS